MQLSTCFSYPAGSKSICSTLDTLESESFSEPPLSAEKGMI